MRRGSGWLIVVGVRGARFQDVAAAAAAWCLIASQRSVCS